MLQPVQLFAGLPQGGFIDATVVDGIHSGYPPDGYIGSHRTGQLFQLPDLFLNLLHLPGNDCLYSDSVYLFIHTVKLQKNNLLVWLPLCMNFKAHSPAQGVTVLLPFYQVGHEFDQAIESIVKQSFREWQLLLISNNSNMEGLEMASKWSRSDSRIRLTEESRQGIASALNTGLEQCSTPYIARMDADDIAHPDRLQRQVSFLESHPDIDVVSSQTAFHSNIPGSDGYSLFVDWQNGIITPEEHDLYRFVESPLAHPTIMFKRALVEQHGPYSTGPVPEDYELWLRWMDQGARFHKIASPLLTWKDHAGRLSRTHDNYSREAFYQVKCDYLARWISRQVPATKKIIVCGSSRIGRKRAALLQDHGVAIFGFTDVKKRPNRQVNFLRIDELTEPGPWFLVNFIARRGVGQAIRNHFEGLGFIEGRDFIMAA